MFKEEDEYTGKYSTIFRFSLNSAMLRIRSSKIYNNFNMLVSDQNLKKLTKLVEISIFNKFEIRNPVQY